MDQQTALGTIILEQMTLYLRGMQEAARREGISLEPYTAEDAEDFYEDFAHIPLFSEKSVFRAYFAKAVENVQYSFTL